MDDTPVVKNVENDEEDVVDSDSEVSD